MRARRSRGIHSLARAPRGEIGYQNRDKEEEDATGRETGRTREKETERGADRQTDRQTETAPPGACTNTPTTHHQQTTDDDANTNFLGTIAKFHVFYLFFIYRVGLDQSAEIPITGHTRFRCRRTRITARRPFYFTSILMRGRKRRGGMCVLNLLDGWMGGIDGRNWDFWE